MKLTPAKGGALLLTAIAQNFYRYPEGDHDPSELFRRLEVEVKSIIEAAEARGRKAKSKK